jgi:hypothetical protein
VDRIASGLQASSLPHKRQPEGLTFQREKLNWQAEGGRADSEDEETAGRRLVETDEGLAVGGSEGEAAAGDAEEIG